VSPFLNLIMRTLTFLKQYWGIIVSLFSIVSTVLSIFFAGVWFLFSGYLIEHSREVLGITEIREFIGANKISFQPPGQSYVKEPVRVGDDLVLVFTSMRTSLGRGCRYLKTIPLFTGSTGIVYSGSFVGPGRQVGPELRRTELTISIPVGLLPGRTVLELELHYTCTDINGSEQFVSELTKPMIFSLLERQK